MKGEINIKKSANASAIMTTIAFVLVAVLLGMFILSQSDVQYTLASKLYDVSKGVQNKAEKFYSKTERRAAADGYVDFVENKQNQQKQINQQKQQNPMNQQGPNPYAPEFSNQQGPNPYAPEFSNQQNEQNEQNQQILKPLIPNQENPTPQQNNNNNPSGLSGGSKASKWTGVAFGSAALVLMFISGALEYRIGYAADPNAMA